MPAARKQSLRRPPAAVATLFSGATESNALLDLAEEIVKLHVDAEQFAKWVRTVVPQCQDGTVGAVVRSLYSRLEYDCRDELSQQIFDCSAIKLLAWENRAIGRNFKERMTTMPLQVFGTHLRSLLARCVNTPRAPRTNH